MKQSTRVTVRTLIFVTVLFIFALKVSAGNPEKHPYLFFTSDCIEKLKIRISSDTAIAEAYNIIKTEADKSLTSNAPIAQMEQLSFVYLMTKDKKYAAKAKEAIDKLLSMQTWTNAEMLERQPAWNSELQGANKNFKVALTFDAIYDFLTPSERKSTAEKLVEIGIKPALGDWFMGIKRIHSLNSMGHNWWSSCVCNAGIASLAVRNEIPEALEWAEKVNDALPQWYGFDGDVLQHKPKSFDEKGGMYESANYAFFGTSEALFFQLAWKNANSGKNCHELPQMKNFMNYVLHISYPRTGDVYSVPFGDSNISAAGERPAKLLYALGLGNADNLWYINQVKLLQHREGLFINTPLGLLYHPDMSNAPKVPNKPTSEIFENFGWATMRNSWNKNETMLAIKSGYTWNHSHADANSFVLFHKGEDIIKDAGNCWYGSDLYPKYFFQSEAHNIVLFNGEGQPTEQQYSGSPLSGHLYNLLDGGSIKYILADGTGPVAKNFTRNFRHFLWIDKIILLIDDLKTYEVGSFEWLWHPGGDSKKQGMDIAIQKNNSAVLIRPLFPETLIKTGFNHDFPEKMKLNSIEAPIAKQLDKNEIYYSVSYPEKVRQVKAVNAIILKDSPEDNNLPIIEKIHGENWIGLKIKQDGKITEVYINQLADGRLMHLNSCVDMNGWNTDAYLLAVTYLENGNPASPERIFVNYGSWLRRDGKEYFDSLSKLFFIAQQNNNELKIEIQGQPIIDATYLCNKPDKLVLNGKSVMSDYNSKTKQLKIKIKA